MSTSHSLVMAAAQDKTATVVQQAAATVSEVAGKGGFEANATVGQLIEFQFTGLLVVFTVLGGLTLICVLIAWIIKTLAPDQYYCRDKATPAMPPPPAAPPNPTVTPGASPATIHPGLADEELLVILAAAATEAMGQAVSVVSFRHMGTMDWTWSVQGRVGQHTSHTL